MKKFALARLFSLVSSFSLLANSIFYPFAVAYAQNAEPTSTPQALVETTPAPTEEPVVSPTPEETVDPKISPTPQILPTPEDVLPLVEETESPLPEPTDIPLVEPEVNENSQSLAPPTTEATLSPTPSYEENGEISVIILENTKASSVNEFDLTLQEESSATIQTDKADYAPTDSVLITGTGFIVGKTYDLLITSSFDFSFSDKVTADEKGDIFYVFQLDGTYRPDYKVEIIRADKVVASVTFTDSALPSNTKLQQWETKNSGGWITGNLGSSNADYKEGETIPFELDAGTLPTSGNPYSFSICRDFQNGSKFGYFSLLPFNTSRPAVPDGIISSTSGPISGVNATVTTVNEVGGQGICGAGQRETQVSFNVIDGTKSTYILWGGKLATPLEVGSGNGASTYSGSSLSMTLASPAKNVSINPDAIIELATITVQKVVDSGLLTPNNWGFSINPNPNTENLPKYPSISGDTVTFVALPTGNYTITETSVPGYVFASGEGTNCTFNNGIATAQVTEGTTATNAVCVFHNTLSNANLTVKKNLDTNGDGQIDQYNVSTWTWDLDSVNTNYSTGSTQSVVIGSHTISEDVQTNWHVTDLTCNGQSLGAVDNAQINVPAEGMECTFTNSIDTGRVHVWKYVNSVNTSTWNVNLTGNGYSSGGFTLGDGQHGTFAPVPVGSGYTLAESPNSGVGAGDTYDSSYRCAVLPYDFSGEIIFTITGSGTSVPLTVEKDKELWCEFHNTQRGHLLVTKVVDPSGNQTPFTINVTGTGTITGDASRTILGSETEDFEVTAGTYSVTENSLAGWYPEYACSNIVIAAGETKTCTINNTQYGSITVIKDAIPNDSQDFSFLTSANLSGFSLDDDADSTLSNTKVFTSLLPGVYSVTENSHEGWDPSIADCRLASGASIGTLGIGSATINLTAGQNVTCTFTNTKNGKIIVEKQVLPNDHSQTFNFSGDVSGIIGDGDTISNDVVPGTYTVSENNPSTSGYRLIGISCDDANSTGDIQSGTATFNVEAGETVKCTFTNEIYGSITAHKFEDMNANGIEDTDDPDLSGWTMSLYTGSDCLDANKVGQDSTDSLGDATFYSIVPGNSYSVKETLQSNWSNITPICRNVSVTSGEQKQIDFGNFELASISGVKFEDLNGNGIKESGEPGLSGWKIYLDINSNGVYDAGEPFQLTASDGSYSFTGLEKGQYHGGYQVGEVLQAGWVQTFPVNGSYFVSTPSGTEAVNIDFGNFKLGSIQGKKFEDVDNSENYSAGDEFLNGWTIRLYKEGDGWGDVRQRVTGHTGVLGQYRFGNLEKGNYLVCEVLKDGWSQVFPSGLPNNQQSDEGLHCWEVAISTSGQEVSTRHFGNFELGSIQGMKFNDEDGDGNSHETGEEYLDDWSIRLYDNTWSQVDSMTTGDDSTLALDVNTGQYRFVNKEAGTYYVCEEQKIGWIQTWPAIGDFPIGDNDVSHPDYGVAVANQSPNASSEGAVCWQTVINNSAELNSLLRFGNSELSDIHGYKWNDLNGNGSEDFDEPKLGGWTIFIDENDNGILDSEERFALTDSTESELGWYVFEGLLPGTYKICEELKPGWLQTSTPTCHMVSLPYTSELRLTSVLNSVLAPPYNFGNMEFNPELILEKSNNKPSAVAGDTIDYTLKVKNTGNIAMYNVEVIDVIPGGFSYVGGSAEVNGFSKEPVISGGVLKWLVHLETNQEVVITYQLKTSSDLKAGTYPNLAICRTLEDYPVEDINDGPSLGLVAIRRVPYVYTECNDGVPVTSTVSLGDVLSYSSGLTPQVLGASTELPATGSSTWYLLFVTIATLGGVALRVVGRRIKNENN